MAFPKYKVVTASSEIPLKMGFTLVLFFYFGEWGSELVRWVNKDMLNMAASLLEYLVSRNNIVLNKKRSLALQLLTLQCPTLLERS
ncbi:conserved hypothetical protein [Ricinus communis]|uniref:Uncharacterized protein n=1 Tax=Ricinus communis TaxID=3988 RepID=B9RYL6_RICCO|nr:conserved hypothetical protein [Ricinus communis]